jgi:sulfhydrogenase subunit beta (sulfur reductase)
MFSKVISAKKIPKLVDALLENFTILAPIEEDDVPKLREITDSSEMHLDTELPMVPAKKVFLPAKQTVFRYSLKEGLTQKCEDLIKEEYDKELLLFGVRPCDITGVNVLKRIFRDHYSDDAFLQLRKNTLIVGINCLEPCYENCFCESMGSNDPKSGYDLMLTPISRDYYYVLPNSDAGKEILRDYSDFFDDPTRPDKEAFSRALKLKNNNFEKDIIVEGLASQIEASFESDVWEQFTKECLFCGSCTFVCPTCYCYNVKEVIDDNLVEGERQREWDSCYFPEFALVAGDHNFREQKSERFRYRYLHKFVDLPRRYNFEGCIGCGRCITYCPAEIDVREVLRIARGEHL